MECIQRPVVEHRPLGGVLYQADGGQGLAWWGHGRLWAAMWVDWEGMVVALCRYNGITGATYCHAGVCWALWLAMEGLCDHGVALAEASGSLDFFTGGIVCAWVGHGLGLQVHGIS